MELERTSSKVLINKNRDASIKREKLKKNPEMTVHESTQRRLCSGTTDSTMSKLVIQQPQPVMVVQDSDEWGSGICDCFQDLPECCFGFWCLPCFACRTSKKFEEDLCVPLLEMFFGGLIPPITMSMRVAMRYRYGIKGSMCVDCVYSTFCNGCSWCQMSREIRRRNIPIVLINAKNT